MIKIKNLSKKTLGKFLVEKKIKLFKIIQEKLG